MERCKAVERCNSTHSAGERSEVGGERSGIRAESGERSKPVDRSTRQRPSRGRGSWRRERAIRTQRHSLDSANCGLYNAMVAANASVAVAPCTRLHARPRLCVRSTAFPAAPESGQRCSNPGPGEVTLMRHLRLKDKQAGATVLSAVSSVVLRCALGVSFLSAVADRFGLWGAFGENHVAWGSFARFVAHTGQLNWFLPKATIPTLAVVSTFAETLVGVLLGTGMADTDRSALKWCIASAVCSDDDRSARDQGTFGLLSLLGDGRSVSLGQLRRLSIQH